MILIVGLGNPGDEYKNTFHNCGFMALDKFCEKNDIKINKNKNNALIFEGRVLNEKVVVAKPLTYMNNSGEAVIALKNSFKPDHILVIYDDIDLPVGAVRYRKSGSSGTHNGMRSIVKCLSSEDFARIRIGIKPDKPIYNLADYVLSKVPKQIEVPFNEALEKAEELIEKFIVQKDELQATSV